MKAGDTFYIDVLGERLAYQIDQIKTVLPEDVSQIAIDPMQDYCTLLTCTPIGQNTHRLLVRGMRVEYAEEEPAPATPEEPTESVWLREYLTSIAVSLGVVGALALILLIVHLIRKRGRS
jgi:sortase A